jgi:hypothetical protein
MLEFRGVRVLQTPSELKAILEELAAGVAEQYKSATISEIPVVKAVRTIFHKTGVDPTRYRPSSEALLRRVLKGKGLYFINSVVDVVNLLFIEDAAAYGRIRCGLPEGPLSSFGRGATGETYQGVGRDVLNLAGISASGGCGGALWQCGFRFRSDSRNRSHDAALVGHICATGSADAGFCRVCCHDDSF